MSQDTPTVKGIQSWRSIIRALVAERKRQGLSLRQAADLMGMKHHNQLIRWEAERNVPRVDNLQRYARALGLRLVIGFERDMTNPRNQRQIEGRGEPDRKYVPPGGRAKPHREAP